MHWQRKPTLNAFTSTVATSADGAQAFPIPDNVFAETVTEVPTPPVAPAPAPAPAN